MVPILIISAFIAAAISGAAGFGGALLLLPVLTMVVGPAHAVPLLTVAQLAGNLSRVAFNFRQIHWRPVGLFLATALPCAIVGSLFFVRLPGTWVTRGIGASIVISAFLRWRGWLRFPRSRGLLIGGGAAVGFISGLAGSAGPLGAAIFHALDLPPTAYIASEAMTSLTLHAAKLAVYRRFVALDDRFWSLAIALGGAMVAGTWVSRLLIKRISVERFRSFVTGLLAVIGVSLLFSGLR